MSYHRIGLAIFFCALNSTGAIASDSCCSHDSVSSASDLLSAAGKSSLESIGGSAAIRGKKILRPESRTVRIQRPVEGQVVFYLERSPIDEFNLWLRSKINPSLCQMVLCQRGCELTQMPCSPLGVSGIRQYLYNRSSEGCCESYSGADKRN